MTQAEFARRISLTRSGVFHLLQKQSIDTAQLESIGNILDYDFFQHLVKSTPSALTFSDALKAFSNSKMTVNIELTDDQREEVLKMILVG